MKDSFKAAHRLAGPPPGEKANARDWHGLSGRRWVAGSREHVWAANTSPRNRTKAFDKRKTILSYPGPMILTLLKWHQMYVFFTWNQLSIIITSHKPTFPSRAYSKLHPHSPVGGTTPSRLVLDADQVTEKAAGCCEGRCFLSLSQLSPLSNREDRLKPWSPSLDYHLNQK